MSGQMYYDKFTQNTSLSTNSSHQLPAIIRGKCAFIDKTVYMCNA